MTEPVWLQHRLALTLHELLIAAHGGPHGVRDESLLESALARPRNRASYENADLAALAAAYAAGIIRNHPVVDGNKRTGFAAAATFLDRNGFDLTASEAEAVQMTLGLADGGVGEGDYAAWIRSSLRPRS